MRAAMNVRSRRSWKGALKRATGDEPEFQVVREYRDELIERVQALERGPATSGS
jgi:hypothetical protein